MLKFHVKVISFKHNFVLLSVFFQIYYLVIGYLIMHQFNMNNEILHFFSWMIVLVIDTHSRFPVSIFTISCEQ